MHVVYQYPTVSVAPHLHRVIHGLITALIQSPQCKMRAKHTERDGTVVYTLGTKASQRALQELVDDAILDLAELEWSKEA